MSGFWPPSYPQQQQFLGHQMYNGEGPSHEANVNRLATSFSAGLSMNDVGRRQMSNLSYDAPVFVPKGGRPQGSQQNYYQQQQQYGAQNNQQQASNDWSSAPSYGGADPSQQYQNTQDDDSGIEAILPEIQTALALLMQDAHNFDKVSYFTLNILQSYVHSDSGIVLVVNLLFSHILQYGSHARVFAQLCSFLSDKFDGQENATANAAFTRLLLKRCYEEYSSKETQIHDPNYQMRFDNFTLFITELYLQLKVNGRRVPMLRDFVRESMLYLLMRPNDENCKTVAHLLNFCGPAMEADEKSESKGSAPEMDSLMTQILTASDSNNLSQPVKNLLLNLRELRTKWGNEAGGVIANGQSAYEGRMRNSNGVYYYEPDGTPLTAEESEFLERNLNPTFDDGDDNEDDIIAEAYEQFLLMQEKQKAAKTEAHPGQT